MASKALVEKRIFTLADYARLLEEPLEIEVDQPAPFVSRIALNLPENRNRMGHVMRAQLLNQLQINDQDPDVRVTIICGAGDHFCSGQDVARSKGALPFFTDETDGQIMRNAVQTWFNIMDLAKPVIAQIHGDCLGSGMELAAACDIVYAADDAQIGYPEGRNMGLPDFQIYPWLCGMRNALSIMLLAETMDGSTAVTRGFATRSFPLEELDARTLDMAKRVARIPSDLLAYNKRSVYRAFEAQGMRANIRHGVDLGALMFHSSSGNILSRAAAQGGVRGRATATSVPMIPRESSAKAKLLQPSPAKPSSRSSLQQNLKPSNSDHNQTPELSSFENTSPPPYRTTSEASILQAVPRESDSEAEWSEPSTAIITEDAGPGVGGVHFHLHEPVNIHVHQTEDDTPPSKL